MSAFLHFSFFWHKNTEKPTDFWQFRFSRFFLLYRWNDSFMKNWMILMVFSRRKWDSGGFCNICTRKILKVCAIFFQKFYYRVFCTFQAFIISPTRAKKFWFSKNLFWKLSKLAGNHNYFKFDELDFFGIEHRILLKLIFIGGLYDV